MHDISESRNIIFEKNKEGDTWLITVKYELFFIIKYIENIFKNIYVAVIFGLNINNWYFSYLWLIDMKMRD